MSDPSKLPLFEQAILPHLNAAYSLARWLTGHDQDAQDVVQEAYLRAFRAFDGFHGTDGRAWLLAIVRNTAYTAVQKNSAGLLTPFDEEIHGIQLEPSNPSASMRLAEDPQRLQKAMDHLPPEFREALVLRYQEDLSYREIGRVAGIPPGTVMSRLARAKACLRKYLAATDEDEVPS